MNPTTTDPFAYLLQLKVNYLDLGYDKSMTKSVAAALTDYLTQSNIDALIDSGSLSGSKITDLSGQKIQVNTLKADRITTSVLDAAVDIGASEDVGAYVRLDGPNNRIVIHDGTNPRIVIGKV